jgi:hypothetical protein
MELRNILSTSGDCEHTGDLSTFYVDLETGKYRLCMECGTFVRVSTESIDDDQPETGG